MNNKLTKHTMSTLREETIDRNYTRKHTNRTGKMNPDDDGGFRKIIAFLNPNKDRVNNMQSKLYMDSYGEFRSTRVVI